MGADLVEGVHVALEDVLVLLALHGRELRVHDELGLGRDARLDVDLDAPEQEGLEHAVQLRDDLLLDLLVLEVEPRVEVLRVGEDVGDEEVEQRPQLVQVVLQRRAWVGRGLGLGLGLGFGFGFGLGLG